MKKLSSLRTVSGNAITQSHFENRGTIYSYFDFSLKPAISVALPTP